MTPLFAEQNFQPNVLIWQIVQEQSEHKTPNKTLVSAVFPLDLSGCSNCFSDYIIESAADDPQLHFLRY